MFSKKYTAWEEKNIVRFNSNFPNHLKKLSDPLLEKFNVEIRVLRLDQYDLLLSGNKYFKLKYNIQYAKKMGFKTIISFGGAYSNHIHALANAGYKHNISTIGIIRGEESSKSNDTLTDATSAGMKLSFVDRKTYRERNTRHCWELLKKKYPKSYIIPEGGGNLLGVKGCMDIVKVIDDSIETEFDLLATAVGTGSTMAGLIAGIGPGLSTKNVSGTDVLGISVIKNGKYIETEIVEKLSQLSSKYGYNGTDLYSPKWSIDHNSHCGGYAKINNELVQFIEYFERKHGIPLEPIYTGKLFFALFRLIREGIIKNKKIIAIHTGGLQGIRGMSRKMKQYSNAC